MIAEKIQELTDTFSMYSEWLDKYEYIIELGKELPPLEENYKNEQFIIKGCQSRVWLVPQKKDNLLYFKADSDALITKGLISILTHIFSGETAENILQSDFSFLSTIGLYAHLSPNRSNGLKHMVDTMRNYASSLC